MTLTAVDDLLPQKISNIFASAILDANSIYYHKCRDFVDRFLNVPQAFQVSQHITRNLYEFFSTIERVNLKTTQFSVPLRIYNCLCMGLDGWKTKSPPNSHIVSVILISGGRSVLLVFETKLNMVTKINKIHAY